MLELGNSNIIIRVVLELGNSDIIIMVVLELGKSDIVIMAVCIKSMIVSITDLIAFLS